MESPAEFNLNEAFVRTTVDRLTKIFGEYGLILKEDAPGSITYQSLVAQLSPFFKGLMKDDRNKLMQILYRIDISEALLQKTLHQYPAMKNYEVVAHLVIKRELQKSVTRHYFSNREKPE